MACGCKKRQQQVQERPPIKITVSEQTNQTGVQLTPEQQLQVEKIVAKIEKINS
jgi:hypothetical protein